MVGGKGEVCSKGEGHVGRKLVRFSPSQATTLDLFGTRMDCHCTGAWRKIRRCSKKRAEVRHEDQICGSECTLDRGPSVGSCACLAQDACEGVLYGANSCDLSEQVFNATEKARF